MGSRGHELFSNVPNFIRFFLFFLEGGDPVPILIGGCQIKCGKDGGDVEYGYKKTPTN